jgi:hypothetical protein
VLWWPSVWCWQYMHPPSVPFDHFHQYYGRSNHVYHHHVHFYNNNNAVNLWSGYTEDCAFASWDCSFGCCVSPLVSLWD